MRDRQVVFPARTNDGCFFLDASFDALLRPQYCSGESQLNVAMFPVAERKKQESSALTRRGCRGSSSGMSRNEPVNCHSMGSQHAGFPEILVPLDQACFQCSANRVADLGSGYHRPFCRSYSTIFLASLLSPKGRSGWFSSKKTVYFWCSASAWTTELRVSRRK